MHRYARDKEDLSRVSKGEVMVRTSRVSVLSWKLALGAGVLSLVGTFNAQAAVGRTAGTFNVSSTGAATYNIPIFTPPGPRGLQPSISLAYNSNSGGGFVGHGWSLTGLSSIKVCNYTVAQDGSSWPRGRYCLNGNKLRVQSGTYGASGSVYATEVADFSRITLTGPVHSTGYWTVEGKDGLIYTYGGTTDSRPQRWWGMFYSQSDTYEWKLSEIRDRSGNKVRITWVLATATAHPDKIEWTQTSSGSGSYVNRMDFSYGTNVATSMDTGYLPGAGQFGDSALLTGITVSVSGTVKRNYVLTYGTSGSTGAKRLTQVKECSDPAQSDCLSPTTISYQDGTPGLNVGSPALSLSGNINYASGDYDFDGDGIKDMLYDVSGTTYVRFGSVSSGYGSAYSTGLTTFRGAGKLLGNHADQFLAESGGTWYVYNWNGSSFSATSTGITTSTMVNNVVVGDVNGDGRDDLFYTTGTSPYFIIYPQAVWTRVHLEVRLNTTTGGSLSFGSAVSSTLPTNDSPFLPNTFTPGSTSFAASIPMYSVWKGGDLNGDGGQDLAIQLVMSWCMYPTYDCGGHVEYRTLLFNESGYLVQGVVPHDSTHTPRLAAVSALDFNADGCSDFTVYDTAHTIGLSDCFNKVAAEFVTWVPSSFPWLTPAAVDWDGDGRKDFIRPPVGGGGYWEVYLFDGLAAGSPISTGIGYCDLFLTDGNGDGRDDVGCVTAGSSLTAYLHNGVNVAADLATQFQDGFGVTHSPTYTAIERGSYSGYSNAAYPYRDVRGDRRVVSVATSTDGIGGTYTNTYTYFGAQVNVQGRGFAGFEKIESVDSRNSVKRVQKFERAFPSSGMLVEESLLQPGGAPMSVKTFTASYHTLDATAFNQRYFPYPSASTENIYEVGGTKDTHWITSTVVSNTVDTTGNVTASTRITTDKDSSSPLNTHYWTQTTAAAFSPNTTYWCLGLPTSTSVTSSSSVSGESTVVVSKGFSPDYVNCRHDAESTGSGALQVDTNYGYDGFGNVNTVSVTGRNPNSSSMTARTSVIGWGTTGQFPVSETNALSQTTTRTFHSTFGSLLTENDPNGIVVVSNGYDSFGRISQQTRPDGTFDTYTYNTLWGCCNPLAAEYAMKTSYDSGSSVIRYDFVFRDRFGRMVNEYHTPSNGNGYWANARSYDSLGRQSSEGMSFQAASGNDYTPAHAISYSYDLLGRVVSQSRPQSQSVATPVTTSYAYAGRTQTVTDPNSKVTTKIVDVNGWMRRSQDHDGYYQSFAYDAAGSLKQVTDSLSNTLFSATYSYGLQPFQNATTDMDLGSWAYSYNSLGELVGWSDAKSQSFSQTYDALSRLTSRTEAEGTTTWTWGTTSGSYNIGRLAGVSMSGYSESLTYDNKGRPSTRSITTDQTYGIDYAYNNQGLLDTLTYPTSTSSTRVKVKYGYAYGMLQSVTDWTSGSAGTVYWTANDKNPRGQTILETLGNGVVTNRNFDAVTGWLNSIQSGPSGGTSLQNQSYLYDLVGNITQRQESTLGLTENFYYDNLYRLDYSQLNGSTNLDLTYDALGNITNRTDVNGNATWTYHSTKKHAVATTGSGGFTLSYDANGNATVRGGDPITWSSYNYPITLSTSVETTDFYYGPDRQYYKQVFSGPSGTETTHYIGGVLEKVVAGGVTDWRHYIAAEGLVVAIVSRATSGNAVYYPLEDNQGSGSTLTNSSGTNLVRQSYNAFGLPRDGADWTGPEQSGDQAIIDGISRRGYTGHSMLGAMGLIHMNGRVQDAITGRFLSPDPNIPNPGFTQSYNRYAYVNNNPLSFTDPSGFAEVNAFARAVCGGNLNPFTGEEPNREWCASFFSFTEMSEDGSLLDLMRYRQGSAGCLSVVVDCDSYISSLVAQGRANRRAGQQATVSYGETEFSPQGNHLEGDLNDYAGKVMDGDWWGAIKSLFTMNKNVWKDSYSTKEGAVLTTMSIIPVVAVEANAARFSLYEAAGGLKGLRTNLSAPEFISNLKSNGYTATERMGTNGPVTVLQNGNGSTWTIYTRRSTREVGAEFFGPNGQRVKYNLGE